MQQRRRRRQKRIRGKKMLIKNNKHFNDARFPPVGEVIEAYDEMMCFGEMFYLCQYNELFIPLKGSDIIDI